jgi:hypothetical protein
MTSAADPLSAAARRLGRSVDGAVADPNATRRRVLTAIAHRSRRRRFTLRLAVGAAMLCAASTAWAAETGRLRHIWTLLTEHAADGREAPRSVSLETPVELTFARAVSAVSTAAESPPSASARSPEPEASAAPPSPAVSAHRAERDGLDREDVLFQKAYDAHFGAHDPAGALVLWDAYLAAAPRGRFAVEAVYNRALCLVRLGRHTEAIAALRPFANGPPGGYRRREARDLIEAMGATVEDHP